MTDILYRVYNYDDWWKSEVENGKIAGTIYPRLEMEMIEIRHVIAFNTNERLDPNSDLTYRVHVSGKGWLDWVRNGQPAGIHRTELPIYPIEAIEIKCSTAMIIYTTYVEGLGWQPIVDNGKTSGTVGRGLPINGIRIAIVNTLVKDFSATSN